MSFKCSENVCFHVTVSSIDGLLLAVFFTLHLASLYITRLIDWLIVSLAEFICFFSVFAVVSSSLETVGSSLSGHCVIILHNTLCNWLS